MQLEHFCLLAALHVAQAHLDPSEAVLAALSHYSPRVTSEPHNHAVYTHLAMALRFSGNFEEAIRVMEKGIISAPAYDSFEVRCVLGNLHRLGGRYDDALRHYRHAVLLHPQNQRGYIANLRKIHRFFF